MPGTIRFWMTAFLCVAFVAAATWLALGGSRTGKTSSEALATLGHALFVDKRLSADGKTSCESCHQPLHAFSDSRATAQGAFSRTGTRNTPSLLNLGDGQPLFWDGRRRQLENAVLDPFTHPLELAVVDDKTLLEQLRTPGYRLAFAAAFGHKAVTAPTMEEAGQALAAYVRSLPRPITPFDRYQARHDGEPLSHDVLEGLRLFRGKAGCSGCHTIEGTPARFSDNGFHPSGTGLGKAGGQLPRLAREMAAGPVNATSIGQAVSAHADVSALGRFMVTHLPGDIGLFRTPSLRYVADTAPYMHDGSVATLEEAVDQEIYWRSLANGHPLSLTVHDRAALIAFLKSLSLPAGPPDVEVSQAEGIVTPASPVKAHVLAASVAPHR